MTYIPSTPLVRHEDTPSAAVSTLQAELSLVNANVDSLDRKAALIPPFLVGAAAFLLGPVGTSYTPAQAGLVAAAVVVGVISSYFAYKAVAPDIVRLGPDAHSVVTYMDSPMPFFQERVAQELSVAVRETSKVTLVKGERLTWGLRLAGLTLVLLVIARIIGGV